MNSMKFQIGKNGITEEVIATLNTAFKTHKQIRVSALKSSGRNRATITRMAEQIQRRLNSQTLFKVIGFTIIFNRRGAVKR
jgi:RNA-binding protein YhbY